MGFEDQALPKDLGELVFGLGLPDEAVVAEVNGEIVKRGLFSQCRLNSGDRVELVRFVGGG